MVSSGWSLAQHQRPFPEPGIWKTNLNLAAVQGWIIVVSPKYICEMEVVPILSQKHHMLKFREKKWKSAWKIDFRNIYTDLDCKCRRAVTECTAMNS